MDETMFESMIDRALEAAKRAHDEIDAAYRSGKDLIQIVCPPNTRRGDIIKVIPKEFDGEHEDFPDDDKISVRVLAVTGMTYMNQETMEIGRVCEAICAVLGEGDITTEEDFAALYADEVEKTEEMQTQEARDAVDALFSATSEELGEAAVAAAREAEEEATDPNQCECGANREMCERNQNVFGGHLNE